jgi:hypothetical protein
LNKSAGSPALYASDQVSPRRRASPRHKKERENENENEEEESEDDTDPARTRKQVRIMDADSDKGFRPQPEEGDAKKNERGKNEDEVAERRNDEDDDDDDYEVLHGGDVTRMPLAQKKRSKSTGLLNALGKRAGANRVDLSDDNMLALLPVPPERTNTFHPIASSAYPPPVCSLCAAVYRVVCVVCVSRVSCVSCVARGKDVEWCARQGSAEEEDQSSGAVPGAVFARRASGHPRQQEPPHFVRSTNLFLIYSFILDLFILFVYLFICLLLFLTTHTTMLGMFEPYRAWAGTTRQMAELSVADIEVVDVRELGWAGHIVVCGCLRGIAQFIAPLREVPRPFCSFDL